MFVFDAYAQEKNTKTFLFYSLIINDLRRKKRTKKQRYKPRNKYMYM